MSNGTPILPLPLPEDDDPPTQELDSRGTIDEDTDDDDVNSADADVIASTEPAAGT